MNSWLSRLRPPRRVRTVAQVALALALAASGATLAANFWIERRTRPWIHWTPDSVPPRTVAIVPGARVHPDGRPSDALADRLQAALDLYQSGKVRKILVSGDHHAPEYDEVNAMYVWMKERGVRAEDLFLDHAGLRTLDTMQRARRVFLVDDAVVCTQAYHLPRSVFLAQRAGIDAVGLVADRHAYTHARANQAREFLATALAVADSYLLRTGPRHLGAPIPIAGDGRATHDDWTP
jgi:SanA protein